MSSNSRLKLIHVLAVVLVLLNFITLGLLALQYKAYKQVKGAFDTYSTDTQRYLEALQRRLLQQIREKL